MKLYLILTILLIGNTIEQFSVMSYNVRSADDTLRYGLDGSVVTRSTYVLNNIFLHMPDTVGFQEVTSSKDKSKVTWHSLLIDGLKSQYNCVGKGRGSDGFGEANIICYKTDSLELIETATKWLSPTPDKAGSQFPSDDESPTDGHPRIFTYVILKNKILDVEYMHINTHLDYKVATNRMRQINVLMDFVEKYKNKYPIIITGDFNSGNSKEEIEKGDAIPLLLSNGYKSAADEAEETTDHWTCPALNYRNGVFTECKKRGYHANGKSLLEQEECGEECDIETQQTIDFVLKPNDLLKFHKYQVITDTEKCGGISSDHYPLYVEGEFK